MRKLHLFIVMIFCFSINLEAKIITDMTGRNVEVTHVTKAFSASPPMMAMLYVLAPKTMIGVNYEFLEVEKTFMHPYIRDLPVLGGFFGGGKEANMEMIIAKKPDIVFGWDRLSNEAKRSKDTLESFGIPVAYIKQDTLEEMLEALSVMSSYLGKEERAKILIKYAKKSLDRVKKSVLNLDKPKAKVYLAQGIDGLQTECSNGVQSEIITYAGGVNVHECAANAKTYKREKISFEKLMQYDPDVIFVREASFFHNLKNSSTWKHLRAFKENKIFLVPSSPFPWVSKPPSLMRFLGVAWLHKRIYLEHFDWDEEQEIKSFYELFLDIKLNNDDLNYLMQGV